MLNSLNKALLRLCNPLCGTTKQLELTSSSTLQVARPSHSVPKTVITLDTSSDVQSASPTKFQKTTSSDIPQPSILCQLPPEILGDIFTIPCHTTTYNFHSDKTRHTRTTPLILGHVCRQWRDIIWSTPKIWSHMSLVLSTTRCAIQIELLGEWLSRSGTCPLHINLLFENEYDWAGRIPTDLIQFLIATSHRWRVVYFVLPEAWYPYLAKIGGNFPLLTKVSTQPLWADCGLTASQRKRLVLFEGAPVLKDLHLNGYYLTDVSAPWAQLTAFTMQHVYLDECLYALARTTNLALCRVYTILENDVGRIIADYAERLTLPIEELVVYSATWSDTARLLSNVRLPKLWMLELSSPKGAPELMGIPPLLQNLGCQLRKLKLIDFEILDEDEELIACLRQIPTLTTLDINLKTGSAVESDFFLNLLQTHPENTTEGALEGDFNQHHSEEGVILVPGAVYSLPQLKDFEFQGTILPHSQFEEKLLQALERRRLSGLLRSFSLNTSNIYDHPFRREIKEGFKALKNRGLQLNIVFNDISWVT